MLLTVSQITFSFHSFNSIKSYTDDCSLFPMDDFITSAVLAMSPEFKLGRLNTLEKLANKKQIVVTNLMGYLKHLPSKNVNNNIILKKDSDICEECLKLDLGIVLDTYNSEEVKKRIYKM